uniref:Uncharacterized protein n=1 Tax=Oryza punctata TaxID=4537 RepID=A0A0E0LBN3_ORYPU
MPPNQLNESSRGKRKDWVKRESRNNSNKRRKRGRRESSVPLNCRTHHNHHKGSHLDDSARELLLPTGGTLPYRSWASLLSERCRVNSRRILSTSARSSGVPAFGSNSHTALPRKPLHERSPGAPPSATFSLHILRSDRSVRQGNLNPANCLPGDG